ncbi:AlwI family type II restriction endonuclease [Selenomonas ruminantium]|uniref:AlwI restriction endonuclease n=1 Tax=Selenomonas ruminantium TaxID=971 RepID=A0A1K1M656_SELRU|nr:AlwI family type II restriction endonuclease [Selenomonas ruminantium]SFW18587.1 AlwI restriction endonuclease [Selenomonas ruminantium]
MYPDIPYENLSWPVTQHAGVIERDAVEGLLHACSSCQGKKVNPETISTYFKGKGLLTANFRSDSNRDDTWRDYQQILSEFGLIYSTRICKELKLTSVAKAYLNGNLTYREMMTLQILRYQYPNGHKTKVTKKQYINGIRLRPAVLIWDVLNGLWEKGANPVLTREEMQSYVVRCIRNDDYNKCVEAIVRARSDKTKYPIIPEARRNLSDWMKVLSQTLLFKTSENGSTLGLTSYAIMEQTRIISACEKLRDEGDYWDYSSSENFQEEWFDYYGEYESNKELVFRESGGYNVQ